MIDVKSMKRRLLIGMLSGVLIFAAGLSIYKSEMIDQISETIRFSAGEITKITNIDVEELLADNNHDE